LKEWVIPAFLVRFHLRLKVHGHICLHHTERVVWGVMRGKEQWSAFAWRLFGPVNWVVGIVIV